MYNERTVSAVAPPIASRIKKNRQHHGQTRRRRREEPRTWFATTAHQETARDNTLLFYQRLCPEDRSEPADGIPFPPPIAAPPPTVLPDAAGREAGAGLVVFELAGAGAGRPPLLAMLLLLLPP
ncbi:unnamed protein product, partial [Ectocarpus sp. 12 AP-2014]